VGATIKALAHGGVRRRGRAAPLLVVGLPASGTPAAGFAYLGLYLIWISVVGLSLLSITAHAWA
jgi:hypothetical protein